MGITGNAEEDRTRERGGKNDGRSPGVNKEENMRREIRALVAHMRGPQLEMLYALARRLMRK